MIMRLMIDKNKIKLKACLGKWKPTSRFLFFSSSPIFSGLQGREDTIFLFILLANILMILFVLIATKAFDNLAYCSAIDRLFSFF